MDDLQVLQALWHLGLIPPHQVPEYTQLLIEAGVDDPGLYTLVGLSEPTYWDVKPLLAQIFRRANLASLSEEQAWWILIRNSAHRILAGKTDLREAAKEIADCCQALHYPDVLLSMYNLWDDYDPSPERKGLFDKEIHQEAAKLLSESEKHI